MHWAHIEARRKKIIRWSELNSLCLCPGCHRWFDSQVTAGRTWLVLVHPERVAWLAEEIEGPQGVGIPRSAQLFKQTITDMEGLAAILSIRLNTLIRRGNRE